MHHMANYVGDLQFAYIVLYKYVMLLLLISSLKQPSNDINIFFASFIDDLSLMNDEGVIVFDTIIISFSNCMPYSFTL